MTMRHRALPACLHIRPGFPSAVVMQYGRGQVDRMSTTLTGTAELLGDYGTEFTLRLAMLSAGHVNVRIEVNHTFAELRIEDETDQTYMPGLREALLSLT
jgi:hypothetical protein